MVLPGAKPLAYRSVMASLCDGVRLGLVAAAIGLILCTSSRAWANEPFAEYFQGMRDRGQYRLAEEYGLRRWGDKLLRPADRSELAVELSRTFAAHAQFSTGEEEAELWRRADESLKPVLDSMGNNPRRIEATVQKALLPVERGIHLAWRNLLLPDDAALRKQAEEQLRSGLVAVGAAIEQLEAVIQKDRPTAAKVADGGMTASDQRRMLERAVFQRGFALAELGRVLPPGPERMKTLAEAVTQLDRLSKVRSSLAFDSRLQRIAVARLQGEFPLATILLNDLANDSLTPAEQERLLAEQTRVAMRQAQHADAIQKILTQRQSGRAVSDEVRAALIDAYLEVWGRARQKDESQLADEMWKEIQTELAATSGPWRVYADSRVEQGSDVLKYGEPLAGQIRAARMAYQAGEIDKSIEGFSEAIGEALRQNQLETAIELGTTRASVLLKAERWGDAAVAFQQIAERFPMKPAGADASLLASYALGKLAEADRKAESLTAYRSALELHLKTFGDHPTSAEARWRLALLHEQAKEWSEAIRLFEQIPATSDHSAATKPRLVRAVLQRWRAGGSDAAVLEQETQSALSDLITKLPAPPQAWSAVESEIAVQFATFQLGRREPKYAEADTLLERVSQSREMAVRASQRDGSKLDPTWDRIGHTVSQLRIVSLAGRQQFDEARQVLAGLSASSPKDLLGVLVGLSEMSSSLPEEPRRELGRLQLETGRRLEARRSELDPGSQSQLDLSLAQAYSATDNIPEAVVLYEGLLARNPGDKAMIRTTTALLSRRGQPADLEKAKAWWIKLESMEKKGSPAWLEAHLEVGRTLVALNRKDEAKKLLRATRILYPDLGGSEIKRRYEELE
jgi:tetratricopeptide (TPR) repeat protein